MRRATVLAMVAWAAGHGHAASGRVLLDGVVPDEATKQAIAAQAREVFGADRVDDRLRLGAVAAPPGWADAARRLVVPALRQVARGELTLHGRDARIEGEVADEAARRALLRALSAPADGWPLHDALRLSAAPTGRAPPVPVPGVEFEPGSARLTDAGIERLDGLLAALNRAPARRFEVVGHTDDAGPRDLNLALSRERAEAVRAHLVARGVAAARIEVRGAGPDEPAADNGTAAGRARNRRIELRPLD